MKRNILDYFGDTKNADGQTTVNASQHINAVERHRTNAHGRAMMKMLLGWEEYADAYAVRYEDQIGTDPLIGRYWAEVGLAIHRLLDGECGGLDCGSLNHNIGEAIKDQGIEHDGYEVKRDD